MSFIGDDFLLQHKPARELYHGYAASLPIIDYHNHLSPREIATDHRFGNLTQAWLAGDHYKWRAMRTLGIDETFITGTATDLEKFRKWAGAVPFTIRNPLYHWTHLELQRYFEIGELLTPQNADAVYEAATAQLQQPGHSARGLLRQMRVEVVCTTDDPADTLEFHRQAARAGDGPRMYPAFRPDAAYAVADAAGYTAYLERLEAASAIPIRRFADLLAALENRIAYFHENGCRLSDHGLEQLYYHESVPFDAEQLFRKVRGGTPLNREEQACFTFEVLTFLCRAYHRHGWVQQFHLGALRNANSRMLAKLGRDTGFDSIGDFPQAGQLAGFLNHLDRTDQLAKTVLYNLNPAWNEVFASMIGNFNDGSVAGKVQFGSGWWYNDQLDGMRRQLDALSNMGLLSRFVGMLTDSRSLLSFPRHEYFRRLLCQVLGEDIQKGLLPYDLEHLGQIVRDICYFNARDYFEFPQPKQNES